MFENILKLNIFKNSLILKSQKKINEIMQVFDQTKFTLYGLIGVFLWSIEMGRMKSKGVVYGENGKFIPFKSCKKTFEDICLNCYQLTHRYLTCNISRSMIVILAN